MSTTLVKVDDTIVEILDIDIDFDEEQLKGLIITDHMMHMAYKRGGSHEVSRMIYDKIEQLAKESLEEGYLLTSWSRAVIPNEFGTEMKIFGKKR